MFGRGRHYLSDLISRANWDRTFKDHNPVALHGLGNTPSRPQDHLNVGRAIAVWRGTNSDKTHQTLFDCIRQVDREPEPSVGHITPDELF